MQLLLTAGDAQVTACASLYNRIRLEIFNSVPPWAIVHAAADDGTAPLIRQGEVAVIESNGTKGWYPVDGGLFLIEYVSPPPSPAFGHEKRTREIVQTRKSKRGWYAASYAAPRAHTRSRVVYCSDGPCDEGQLAEKLLGPVVGIYRPVSHLQ